MKSLPKRSTPRSRPLSRNSKPLARALDFDDAALFETDRALLDAMMAQMQLGYDFDELKRRGHFTLGDSPQIWYADRQFETPSGRIEIASEQAVSMGLPRAPRPWASWSI